MKNQRIFKLSPMSWHHIIIRIRRSKKKKNHDTEFWWGWEENKIQNNSATVETFS